MFTSLRNQKIDFLRGIAILSVLILHFNLSYHLIPNHLVNVFPLTLLNTFVYNGNYGVTMFFVISGFLITSASLARFQTLKDK
jgi:peptidoglycan/LPS O-acetylase OafA/YrhL